MQNSKAVPQAIVQPIAAILSVLVLMHAPEEMRGLSLEMQAVISAAIIGVIQGVSGYWATWFAPPNKESGG